MPTRRLRWLLSVRVGRKEYCDYLRGQLRTIMALWWLQGLVEDHKGGLCGHSVRHRLQCVYRVRYWGWLRTSKVAFVLTLLGL